MLENAQLITADSDRAAPVVLTRELTLDQPREQVTDARLHATAHGIYEARIDGRPATESVLNPGWTAYEWRLQVQEFDVTDLIRAGGSRLEVTLANGWWRGDLGFEKAMANYGQDIGFAGQLDVTYADGTVQAIGTDAGWAGSSSDSPAASLYGGQRIDARLRAQEPRALPVRELEFDRSRLVPQVGPLIKRQETIAPVEVWTSPSGKTLVDFGQNLVGWLRLRVQGEAGAEIVVRHAEVLEHGELGTRPLRGADATDTFVLSGGEDVFEPTLTFHGFRYAEVTGFPGEITPEAVEAVVVHSQMERTGWFECSDALVNQLVSNSIWGQKGNFLDVPTDCPQRDERLGWTGDIAAYAATAAFQFDSADFLHKWLLDVQAETAHNPGGYVPYVVPDVLKYADFASHIEFGNAWQGPTAVWGDATVWVPQALWHAYGDRARLAARYPGMVLHLESVERVLSDSGLWDTGFQFGDWLDPDASPHDPAAAKADKGVVATACLYRSARFAASTARELGKAEEAQRWEALAARVRAAFAEHYVGADGRITSDCATVYALAICFDLLDDDIRAAAGARLADVVADREYKVTTGFAGTPYVTWALSETGHVDAAYRLLLEKECPSWLYPVTIGATTIWERWDSMLPDGTINPGDMTSFNHYALGAVADWLYQVVAGIRPAAPGYAEVLFKPTPGPGLDWAKAALDSPHGRIECGWRREGSAYVVDVLVPEGVSATAELPDGTVQVLSSGAHTLTSA